MKYFPSFLVFVLVFITSAAAMAQAPDRPGIKPPSITVVGTGEAHGKPDLAQVQVGVVTEAATAAEAVRKNNEAMNRLMAMIRKRGIEDRDVKTTQFNVSPKYKYDKTKQEPPLITGYQVTNEVNVKIRKLSVLGEFMDETVSQGANQIRRISFDIAEPEKLFDEARRKAMADAQHRALIYAEGAGLKLGKPITIEEQTDRSVPYTMSTMDTYAASAAPSAVPVAPGEQAFTIRVNVSFAIAETLK